MGMFTYLSQHYFNELSIKDNKGQTVADDSEDDTTDYSQEDDENNDTSNNDNTENDTADNADAT